MFCLDAQKSIYVCQWLQGSELIQHFCCARRLSITFDARIEMNQHGSVDMSWGLGNPRGKMPTKKNINNSVHMTWVCSKVLMKMVMVFFKCFLNHFWHTMIAASFAAWQNYYMSSVFFLVFHWLPGLNCLRLTKNNTAGGCVCENSVKCSIDYSWAGERKEWNSSILEFVEVRRFSSSECILELKLCYSAWKYAVRIEVLYKLCCMFQYFYMNSAFDKTNAALNHHHHYWR